MSMAFFLNLQRVVLMSNLISVRLSDRAEDKVETYRAYLATVCGISISRNAAINALLEAAEIPSKAPDNQE